MPRIVMMADWVLVVLAVCLIVAGDNTGEAATRALGTGMLAGWLFTLVTRWAAEWIDDDMARWGDVGKAASRPSEEEEERSTAAATTTTSEGARQG